MVHGSRVIKEIAVLIIPLCLAILQAVVYHKMLHMCVDMHVNS